ncbi:MAG: 30S ribosomal protein S18 [Candidatus Magasanikbacteria bacterium RIFOXYC12_FULL_33_11]|uniref:Small ribosomal subunit protein bS18 n=2 Tax=Candidatus Magasanikiibacteriota TaxID=1752731 RepID=A0A1F6NQ42_9BACT|nr:MAG: 30S ribosomal protein S18 [Candidatus Magasanikbacteria bacterium RIFOXYC12_FULL_33_11]PIZ95778.1 MAG: 30S ribosomal protein S18 [Candidatus Magasanikbacteria bacterium CG_4_10_14_0_2_um_filter_33_14]
MIRNNNQTQKKEKQCFFCVNKDKHIDYKDNETLRRFTSSYMKIQPRRRSGLCAKHQRQVAKAIKQARIAGLLAFVPK